MTPQKLIFNRKSWGNISSQELQASGNLATSIPQIAQNLKKKRKRRKKETKLTENRLMVARGGDRWWGKWVKGLNRYKLKKSWGCNTQNGDYS